MNATLKHIIPKIKNGIIYGFTSGFCIGCFPNKLSIKFEDKQYNSIPIPLITGLIGSMGVIVSPLLITNYVFDGVYFDKLYDKYDVRIERYYQYDYRNNKYDLPSLLALNIKTKDKTC
jgi:hypothetical protein